MKTQAENRYMKTYIMPTIERIILDNEISLSMQSALDTPPALPNEGITQTPEYFNRDPFKDCIS